jgi:hypothetical protein
MLALLKEVGYDDFRSARGPLGFTQRQGLGKFTLAEADELIEQLEREPPEAENREVVAPASRAHRSRRPLQDTSTEELIAELRSRGWAASRAKRAPTAPAAEPQQ